MLDRDRAITAEAIKNILLGVTEKKKMIMDFFQEHNELVEAVLDKEFAPGTIEAKKIPTELLRISGIFFFSCYTGLAYIEVKYKKRQN